MLTLFRTNQLVANILLIFYVLLLRFSAFIPQSDAAADLMPPGSAVLSQWAYQIVGSNGISAQIIAIVLVFFQAILINVMVARHRLGNEVTLFPGLFYVFLTSCLSDFLYLSPLLMANTFYILAIMELFNSYKKPSAAGKIYNVGLWAGIGSLFYFSYLIFFLFGFIALGILRAFRFRERIILLLGLLSTLVLAAAYSFWTDQLALFWQQQFSHNLGFFDLEGETNWLTWVKISLLGLLLIICVLSYNRYVFKKNIQKQKYINILYWGLLLSAFTLLFQREIRIEHLLILTAPMSILLSFNFLDMKKPTAEAVHLLMVFAVLVLQFEFIWMA
ncbi:MAG: DUF6427 family protein [Bacteroidota bacterium]